MKHRLKAARVAAGLTQTELAHAAGLSQRLVSSIETGTRTGSMDTWRELARALGVNVSWLSGEVATRDPSEVGPAAILTDEAAPPGLKQLAADQLLVSALEVTTEEWAALRSLRPPGVLTKGAYLAVLYALRASVKSA